MRVETDLIGTKEIEKDAYYGLQTLRAYENFNIPGRRVHPEFIRSLAAVKKAAAITNCQTGELSEERKNAIVQACDEILAGKLHDAFITDSIQGGAGTSFNMNANEVIASRAIEILGGEKGDYTIVHPNDHVNMSQSTNDVIPTAGKITAIKLLQGANFQLTRLIGALRKKEKEFDHILKMGRTQMQDAVPIRFSQEISGWRNMLEKTKKMLEASLPGLKELALGGTAVGTGLNAPKNFGPEVAKVISELTGKEFVTAENKFHALTAKDDITFAHGALKALAADLMKIANDVRWLASGPRCGLGEISIPENEPGSSIMPGKVNPTQCEAMTMVAVQVMGNDAAIGFAASQGNFELNVFMPVIAYNFLQSVRLLSDVIVSFNDNCAVGIKANREKMKHNLHNSLMLVTALNPYIGYDNAAKTSKKAYKENISLKEACVQLGFLTAEKFDEVFHPEEMA